MVTEILNKSKFTRKGRSVIRQASTLQDDVSMTPGDESHMEVHMQKDTLANPKITRRIGTWNVRTMYATGKTA